MEGEETLRDGLERKKHRAVTLAKAVFILSTIYLILFIAAIFMVYYSDIGYRVIQRLHITLPFLVFIGIAIYALLTAIVLLLYLNYRSTKKRLAESKREAIPPKKEGEKIFSYTLPEGARGGIFSRTVIYVDENTMINIRYQMVKPEELWLS